MAFLGGFADTILVMCAGLEEHFYEYRVAAVREDRTLFTQGACAPVSILPRPPAPAAPLVHQPYLVLLPSTQNEVVVEHNLVLGNHNVLGCSVYARHSPHHNVNPGAQRHQRIIFIIKTVAAKERRSISDI